MARTLGQVREILLKTPHCAGADLLLLTERINGRYQELLNSHPWSRLQGMATLTTFAAYTTGTVAIATGATAVVLTDGTFPTNLSGGRFRIVGDQTWYVLTRTGATTGTLDRAYEGADQTAGSYTLWQPIYALPSDCDIVRSISVPSQNWELDESTQEELDEKDASRWRVEPPQTWARYKDTTGGLPQIELWPGPTLGEGLPLRYETTGTIFALTDAATSFPTWVDTDAIIAGVEADFLADAGSPLAQIKEQRYGAKVAAMFAEDCQRMAGIHLDMADRWVYHRVARELQVDRIDRRAILRRSF